jgi:hypothetical protein
MRYVLALLLCTMIVTVGLVGMAGAQDFVWNGWYGQEWTNSAWGHEWTYDNSTYSNGWGRSWAWHEDKIPYYPSASTSVGIPEGVSVDVEGGIQAACSTLAVGAGANLNILVSSVAVHGDTLRNDGTITITNYTASWGFIEAFGNLEIVGNGTIDLQVGRIQSWSPFALSVSAGQTVTGGGALGWEPYGNYTGVDLTNHGTISATNTSTTLDIMGLEVHNPGLVEAIGGAEMRVWGNWDNNGGEIWARDGSSIRLMNAAEHQARIAGGWLRTEGTGQIIPESEASLKDLALDGLLNIPRYQGVHMSGTITNQGSIEQGTGGYFGYAHVAVDSALTFLGDGTLRMGAGNAIHMHNWPDHNAVVTNGSGHTMELYAGAIGTLPDYYGDRRVELVNRGAISCYDAVGHNEFRVTGAGFLNRGTLTINPSPSHNTYLNGAFHQVEGLTLNNDGFIAQAGQFEFSGGRVSGHGYFQGAVAVGDSAIVNPGGVEEAGTLTIYGPLVLTDGATLVSDWAHNGEDLVQIHGAVTATGNLTVRLEYIEPGKAVDMIILSAEDHDDSATWTVELPDGWTHSALEWVGHDLVLRGLTGFVADTQDAPVAEMALAAAPNPFNPRTTIQYEVQTEGLVTLWVADLAGRRVRTLVNEERPAGRHQVVWNGQDDSGRAMASGVYLGVLQCRGERRTSRMTLVR